jgi:hypothetical protein
MPVFQPFKPPKNPDECAPWLYEAITRLNRGSTQASQGLAAIIRGEMPDGSGTVLMDLTKYLYLPGRMGGQTVQGN